MSEPDTGQEQPGTDRAPSGHVGHLGGEEGQVLLRADQESWDRLRSLLTTVGRAIQAVFRPPVIVIVAVLLAVVALVVVAR